MLIAEGILLAPKTEGLELDEYMEIHSILKTQTFFRIDRISSYDMETKELLAFVTRVSLPGLAPNLIGGGSRQTRFGLDKWQIQNFEIVKAP